MSVVDCEECSECKTKTTVVIFNAWSGNAGLCAFCLAAGASAILEDWAATPKPEGYDPCNPGGDE